MVASSRPGRRDGSRRWPAVATPSRRPPCPVRRGDRVLEGREGHRVERGADVPGRPARAHLLDEDVGGARERRGGVLAALRLDGLVRERANGRVRTRSRGLVGIRVERVEELRATPLLPSRRGARWLAEQSPPTRGRRWSPCWVPAAASTSGHLAPEIRPVRERHPRQQAALADPEDRHLASGQSRLAAQSPDEVLHGDLDVRRGGVRGSRRNTPVPVRVDRVLADEVGLRTRGAGAGHEHDRGALRVLHRPRAVERCRQLGPRDRELRAGGRLAAAGEAHASASSAAQARARRPRGKGRERRGRALTTGSLSGRRSRTRGPSS